MHRLFAGLPFVALVALMTTPAAGQDQQWGTIKGTVTWAGDAVPTRAELNVDKDKKECLAKGPLLSEDYVVDGKTKGVQWVMVWLVDAKDAKAKLPVHPALQAFPKTVAFDQPCCMFEPHVLGVRAGQVVEAKNSATIPHNVNVIGGAKNPNENVIIPAGKSHEIKGWNASPTPVSVSCTIHPWMKMYIRVFDHPYYAVTDAQGNFEIKNAPAGDYKVVVWHETNGWVVGDKTGVPITVKAGGVTDFPVKMTPRKE